MASQDLSPLRFNPKTGEAYIPFPAPHTNLILTPPRLTDANANYAMMNDPKVISTLEGPPYPYLESHATEWVTSITKEAEAALQEYKDAVAQSTDGSRKLVSRCPVRYIREVQEDGTDVYLGDVDIHRCGYPDVQDAAERARLCRENESRELGDPELMWCIGDCLASSHHGKGIMTAAFRTLMTEWYVPCMGVKAMRVEAFEGNIGSVKVFEKNGFKMVDTVPCPKLNPYGVLRTGLHVLIWRASST
ncbi:hypothetical protein PHLGIDRAFT_92733 [Phlebiopsis gigantea 11061_1 CR5-6]|uniref:N-acetyltransferase domain-containing protein n=1 Tax=Phlebiopsis gigantea (strain 11061_1 CR5-6) TaxID=745531 RepID=A0A0C3PGS1_PHLG1|nr:hypothetical protein PHLGIDRAFT_92733 [Phlebiopsis gigantea 11061_1 CR5-6]